MSTRGDHFEKWFRNQTDAGGNGAKREENSASLPVGRGPLVPHPVMAAAQDLAVPLLGEPALRIRHDVVDLARSAGRSQNSCWHCRSRTSMARRVAPVKNRDVTEHSARLSGPKTIRSKVASSIQRNSDPGVTTGPCANSEIAPGQRRVVDDHSEEGLGAAGVGGGTGRAHRHLDHGVGPALGRGAGQLVGVGVSARGALWPRPSRPRRTRLRSA